MKKGEEIVLTPGVYLSIRDEKKPETLILARIKTGSKKYKPGDKEEIPLSDGQPFVFFG